MTVPNNATRQHHHHHNHHQYHNHHQQHPLEQDIANMVHNVGKSPTIKKPTKTTSMNMTTTERLKACLRDNNMTDVALVGDDGIPIPAIRCVLGSASPVLKQLLYTPTGTNTGAGASPESSLTSDTLTTRDEEGFVITLEPQKSLMVSIPGFHSKTLRALVEYCCSDGDLRQTSFANSSHTHQDPAQTVMDLLEFAQLAITYEIPKLPQQVVDDFVTPLTKRYPPVACSVLNHLLTVDCYSHPPSQSQSPTLSTSQEANEKVISAAAALTKLYTTALTIIRHQPYAALTPCKEGVGGVLALHADSLVQILQDRHVEADELFLFQQLQVWHQHHYCNGHNNIPSNSKRMTTDWSHNNPNEGAISSACTSSTVNVNPNNHKITDTLQKMTQAHQDNNNSNNNDNKKKDDDDDSFQFEANFNEFMLSNADSNSTTASTFNPVSSCSNSTASSCSTSSCTSTTATLQESYRCPNPTAVCRELVQHLDLAAIDPLALKHIVAQAPFVDTDLLMEALWEQATSAARHVSFGAIVRGNSNSNGKDSIQVSHIRVQGAGVDDCNGIYAQVMQPTSGSSTSRTCEDVDVPSSNSSVTTASTSTENTADEVPTGICVRFVKQTRRKQHNKGKTWYLVCRRELVALRPGSAAPFQHQWSIIEQDNRGGGQLRVLYEWEPTSSVTTGTGTPNAPHVLDSSTVQPFPTDGWTCVRGRFAPSPMCTWHRPRHGSLVLVVPPGNPKQKMCDNPHHCHRHHHPTGIEKPTGKHKKVPSARPPPPPPPSQPLPVEQQQQHELHRTDTAMADSLVGLSIVSSTVSKQTGTDPDSQSLVGLGIVPSVSCSDMAVHGIISMDTTLDNNNHIPKPRNKMGLGLVHNTNASSHSSFRIATARRRVSLADTSLETSDTPKLPGHSILDDATVMTYEI